MSQRFLVIGSNSFTGASFVRHLVERGDDVVGTSRSAEPIDAFLPYKWPSETPSRGTFRFEQLDLNHHTEELAELARALAPVYVVNFAAQSMVAESWQHPEHWYQTNVVANVALHDRLRKIDGLQKYVHVSTPEVYGSTSKDIDETAPFNPSTPYAASRAGCDLHLMTFFRQYNFPVVFTRAANVYGPGQQLYRIIPRTILYIRLGRKLQLHGGGRSVRSFIHAEDVSDGTRRIAMEGTPGESYHLSTNEYVSIRELVERICARMNVPFSDAVENADDRPGKDAAYLLKSDKLRAQLGWTDRISLDEGISQTIAWVDRNLAQLREQSFDYIHKP